MLIHRYIKQYRAKSSVKFLIEVRYSVSYAYCIMLASCLSSSLKLILSQQLVDCEKNMSSEKMFSKIFIFFLLWVVVIFFLCMARAKCIVIKAQILVHGVRNQEAYVVFLVLSLVHKEFHISRPQFL